MLKWWKQWWHRWQSGGQRTALREALDAGEPVRRLTWDEGDECWRDENGRRLRDWIARVGEPRLWWCDGVVVDADRWESFGQRLRAARTSAGFTQAALARQLSVSTSVISRWERDERLPWPMQLPGLLVWMEEQEAQHA